MRWGPSSGNFFAQGRSGGQKAGVTTHYDADIDPRQRPIVEIGSGEGLSDEARRRRETGRMVVDHKIVVYGLGDMDGPQRIAVRLGLLRHYPHRVGAVIAADVKKAADLVRLQNFEDFLAIFQIGLIACRT